MENKLKKFCFQFKEEEGKVLKQLKNQNLNTRVYGRPASLSYRA
jgi:hypothetical protein